MSERLAGKIAIITGASRGIGAAIAEAFAGEAAQVVIASRKQEALDAVATAINEKYADRVAARACHTGRAEEIAALVEWTAENVGEPTVLVNNAATNPYFGPMLDAPDWAWDKTFDVNARGYYAGCVEVGKRLRSSEAGGSIINVTSVLGLGAARLQGIYGMTKAAVISMTQTLAFELGGSGVRVNAIAPGLVDTKLASIVVGNPEITAEFTRRTALGRYCMPDEIAGTAVWLASDESKFVTGQTIAVDGGYSVA